MDETGANAIHPNLDSVLHGNVGDNEDQLQSMQDSEIGVAASLSIRVWNSKEAFFGQKRFCDIAESEEVEGVRSYGCVYQCSGEICVNIG